MTNLTKVLFALCLGCLNGVITGSDWDNLQVRWDLLPTRGFFNQPLTVSDAVNNGFVKISDCDSNAAWRGARYVKGNDRALTLLYDIRGTIAGIQTALPNNLANGYPRAPLQPPFVKDGAFWVLTVYFTNPATICSSGRSTSEKVGSLLYLQNGSNPEASTLAPRYQKDAAGTEWVEGECFKTMGKHYWWKINLDTNCDAISPFFLLYNGGELNGFGFAMTADLASPIYEHPTIDVIPKFMTYVPRCLGAAGIISTLHVYLQSWVILNWC